MVAIMSLTDFSGCKTVAETNQVFKDLFIKLKARHDNSVANQLRETHRKAMESIIYEIRAVERRERSDAALHLPTVKNWCIAQGMITASERINKTHKDAYRQAHGLPSDGPVVDPKPPEPEPDAILPPASTIRLWCALNGIECGKRGRLHPDVIRQYKEAQRG